MIFYSHANITHFHKKDFDFVSLSEWEFLELGNGLRYQCRVVYVLLENNVDILFLSLFV